MKRLLAHPLTLVAAAVCGLYPVAAWRILGVWHWSAILLAAGSLSAWVFLLSRTAEGHLAVAGVSKTNGVDDEAAAVSREFDSLGHREGGVQVLELSRKYRNLTDILSRRLSPSEVSYGRYLGIAGTVYQGAIENLKDIAIGLRNLDGIAPNAVPRKLSDLRGAKIRLPDDVRAVAERRNLYEEERKRIVALIEETEEAMTAIDRTSTALARTRTETGAELDLADAMKEMEMLAGKAAGLAARRKT